MNSFLNYLSVERGLSNNTIISYREDLNMYLDFIEKSNIDVLSKISKVNITNFMFDQKGKGIAANSIARRLAAIRMFHRFLTRERILKDDPSALIDSPKLWKRIPETLTLNEVEVLIAQPDTRKVQGARDRAILETLYATGMRVSEAVNFVDSRNSIANMANSPRRAPAANPTTRSIRRLGRTGSRGGFAGSITRIREISISSLNKRVAYRKVTTRVNHGKEPFEIVRGSRIAQIVVAPVCRAHFVLGESLMATSRGEGGFGHTGTH